MQSVLPIEAVTVGDNAKSSALSKKQPKRTTTATRRQASSQAAAISRQWDRPLAWAFVTILVIYIFVNYLTFEKLTSSASASSYTSSSNAWNSEPQLSSSSLAAAEQHQQQNHDKGAEGSVPDNVLEELQHHSFPVHVTEKDMEWIEHPGLALADHLHVVNQAVNHDPNVGKDLPRKILVPQFWAEMVAPLFSSSSSDPKPITSIRQLLGEGGQRIMTKDEAALVGSYSQPNQDGGGMYETIYCSVASYRDPECTLTVQDLYERAEHPERIRVAVIDQAIVGEDIPCLTPAIPCSQDSEQVLCKYRHLMDYYHLDAQLAVGPVFARHLAHRLYRGEYYAMQVDSHVRFTHHWDSDIIDQWKSAKNEYNVLTTYLSDINGRIHPVTHQGTNPDRPIMCNSDFEGGGDYKHLRHGQQPEGPPGIHGQPTLQPFWAAGYSFARGHFVVQVPYDQYLPMVFQGEEISIGLRGFSYGYDYYAAERGTCFHIYASADKTHTRNKIHMFWENNKFYHGVGDAAMKRLNTIIGLAPHPYPENEWPTPDQDKYGLGHVRTTDTFFRVFGIHVQEQRIEKHLCHFVGKPMMKEFLPALRSNGMGLDYDKITFEFKDLWPDNNNNSNEAPRNNFLNQMKAPKLGNNNEAPRKHLGLPRNIEKMEHMKPRPN